MAEGFAGQSLEKQMLSMDDIQAILTRIAKDPDNRDQIRALKMLSGMNSGAVVLPPPMEVDERIDRLARLMKAMTREQCRLAYHRAHPKAKTEITDSVRLEVDSALTAEEVEFCRSISSARMLMKKFPELRMPRGGVPKGFPYKSKGEAARREWLYTQAALAIIHKKQKAIDAQEASDPTPA